MARPIRFIHTADLHLGSPLNSGGMLPERISNRVRKAGYSALQRIFEAALKYQVDFVVIAGDLYDREARSVEASRFFVEECRKLEQAEIPILIISGNHDPLCEELEPFDLPENVFTFCSEEADLYEVKGQTGEGTLARVLGQSYRRRSESRKMYSSFVVPDSDIPNIGILHTQLEPQNTNYVPCSLEDLKGKDEIHYWALGHLHQTQMLNSSQPVVAYAGTPQGRDPGETGPGGSLLVRLEPQSRPVIQFIPTSSFIFLEVEVSIDSSSGQSPKNLTDLASLMEQRAETLLQDELKAPGGLKAVRPLSEVIEGYIVRWIVRGRGPLHEQIVSQREEVEDDLLRELRVKLSEKQPFLWTHSILFRTGRPLPPLEELEEKNQVFKEARDVVADFLSREEIKAEVIERWGEIWDLDWEDENGRPERFFPDEKTYQAVIEQAQQLVIEQLLEGREER